MDATVFPLNESLITSNGSQLNESLTDEYYYEYVYDETSRLIQVSGLMFLVIFGTVGNGLAFIVMRRGSMKKVSTCFYMSMLALADTGVLWFGAFTAWIWYMTHLTFEVDSWTDCKVIIPLFYFFGHVSSFLLCVMSVEKFIALYFPLKTKSICTVKTAKWVTGIIVIVFLGFDVQLSFMMRSEGDFCLFVSESHRETYFIVDTVIYSFAPFAIMGLANLAIIYKFLQAKWSSRNEGTESTSQALSKSAIKGTAMLITVSITFIVLTAPIVILYAVSPRPDPFVNAILTFMQYLNHSINGVLYCIVGSRFRNELINLVCCRNSSSRKSQRSRSACAYSTDHSKSFATSNTEFTDAATTGSPM